MFRSTHAFGPVAALMIGAALITLLVGGGSSALIGVGIALYFLLHYFNQLEKRDKRRRK